jgi:hypothetical protein
MRLPMRTAMLLLASLFPAAAMTQPWKVVVSVNPLRIGTCNQVGIRAYDPNKNTNANNGPGGTHYVSMADFDMAAQSAGNIVVGKYEGTIWNVCACQRATVGSQATITATYPARAMPADHFVSGMPGTASTSVVIIAGTGVYDPPGCAAAAQTVATAGTELLRQNARSAENNGAACDRSSQRITNYAGPGVPGFITPAGSRPADFERYTRRADLDCSDASQRGSNTSSNEHGDGKPDTGSGAQSYCAHDEFQPDRKRFSVHK